MADISFKEVEAKMWADDVDAEVEAVEQILKNVTTALTTMTTNETADTIMSGIYNVGSAMESAWSVLCNTFKKVTSEYVRESIKRVVNKAVELDGALDSIKAKNQ